MDPEKIAFHQTSLAPNVREYLADACSYGQSLFRGKYNQMCREVIEAKFNCGDVVLTSSCTDALTMATLVAGIGQGDAVIIPSLIKLTQSTGPIDHLPFIFLFISNASRPCVPAKQCLQAPACNKP